MLVSMLPGCTRKLDNLADSGWPVDKSLFMPELPTALYLDSVANVRLLTFCRLVYRCGWYLPGLQRILFGSCRPFGRLAIPFFDTPYVLAWRADGLVNL